MFPFAEKVFGNDCITAKLSGILNINMDLNLHGKVAKKFMEY